MFPLNSTNYVLSCYSYKKDRILYSESRITDNFDDRQACSEQELPLEGAKARLEELQESLYQREREITELLGAEGSPIPPPPCATLLPVLIQKVPSSNSNIHITYIYNNSSHILQPQSSHIHIHISKKKIVTVAEIGTLLSFR